MNEMLSDAVALKDDPRALSYPVICEQVANHLISMYHVAPELIAEHARILEDLGLD